MAKVILEIKNLSKSFSGSKNGKNNETTELLHDLQLSVNEGEVTALIGGNGTGKTTLFNIISGFLEADQGEILFANETSTLLNKMPSYKRERIGIGRLFQDNHIFPSLTVLENLIIADKNFHHEKAYDALFKRRTILKQETELREKAKQMIVRLMGDDNDMITKLNDLSENLSYGQKRLLGLIRLFMGDYKLVLLDEPTAGINPALIDKIAEIIRKMVSEQGITVFLIEHNMAFVKKVADKCMYINDRQILKQGTPDEVLRDEFVQKSYLGA